jgi:methylated-DNA-protein-cysteine methyltransferase-like protein
MSIENPTPETFNPLVWEIVRQVPRGVVTTFGQLASMIPPPDGVDPAGYAKLGPRWVGDAMNAVSFSDDPTVPWHRVINARGGISLPADSRSAKQQRARLEAEGVVFGKKDTCSLDDYGWDGPDAAWLDAHGLLTPKPLRKPDADNGQMRLF